MANASLCYTPENGTLAFKQQLSFLEQNVLPSGIFQLVDRLIRDGIAPGDVFQLVAPEDADLVTPVHTRRELLLHEDTAPVRRRRLSGHDEWGGVEYSVQLAHYANVYTKGRVPSVFEVIASVGGASGSLIGLIGMLIAGLEVTKSVRLGRGGRAGGPRGHLKKGGGGPRGDLQKPNGGDDDGGDDGGVGSYVFSQSHLRPCPISRTIFPCTSLDTISDVSPTYL